MFGVPKTLALAYDPMNKEAFERAGITIAFSITSMAAGLLDQSIAADNITQVFPLEQGKLVASRLMITAKSPSLNRTLQYLALPNDTIIAVVFRGDDVIIPRGQTVLMEGDAVLVIGTPESQGKVVRMLAGDEE